MTRRPRIAGDSEDVAAQAVREFKDDVVERWLRRLLDVPPPQPKDEEDEQQEIA